MDVLGEESDPNFNDKIGDNSYQKLDVNLSTGVIVDKQNEVDNHEVIEGHEDDGAARAIESQSNEPMLDETSEMNSSGKMFFINKKRHFNLVQLQLISQNT